MSGTLYVVATPIGNLADMTVRATRVLGEVDLIACEDTRQTRKLLDHYGIKTPLISYHEHNEQSRSEDLLRDILAGKNIALVSDAGTPLIADPGYRLVERAREQGVVVSPDSRPIGSAGSPERIRFADRLFSVSWLSSTQARPAKKTS